MSMTPGDWDEITRDRNGKEIKRVSIHVDLDGSEWVCYWWHHKRDALLGAWRELHETTMCAVRIREVPGTPWYQFWGQRREKFFVLEKQRA